MTAIGEFSCLRRLRPRFRGGGIRFSNAPEREADGISASSAAKRRANISGGGQKAQHNPKIVGARLSRAAPAPRNTLNLPHVHGISDSSASAAATLKTNTKTAQELLWKYSKQLIEMLMSSMYLSARIFRHGVFIVFKRTQAMRQQNNTDNGGGIDRSDDREGLSEESRRQILSPTATESLWNSMIAVHAILGISCGMLLDGGAISHPGMLFFFGSAIYLLLRSVSWKWSARGYPALTALQRNALLLSPLWGSLAFFALWSIIRTTLC